MNSKIKSKLAYLLLFLFSFIFFSPLTSEFLVMGNDFDQVYYAYKKYIFEFYQEGEIPLWSPVEGAGYSLVFNPFAQFFYPPSWILYFFLNFFGTFSLYHYLIYNIFFVSLFSLFNFQWLKSLRIFNKRNCFLVSLLIPCCLILSNFLRFPNAILTIAWFPLLLTGINYSCFENKKIKSFILIFLSTLLIFTAGYPYIVIYMFIFCFFYSFFIYLFFNKKINFFLYLFKILLPIFMVLLVLSPWLYGVVKTLAITQDRNIASYNFATQHIFTIRDYIASLTFPIAANTEGRFFFGTIITFLVFYFVFTKQKKIIINNNHKFLFYFIITVSVTTIIIGSANNIFFEIIWHKISPIQHLRTWPRINILLLPIIVLILTYSLELIENKKFEFNDKKIIYFLLILIFSIQLFFYLNDIKDMYWYQWHEKRYSFAKEYFDNFFSILFEFNKGLINLFISIILLIFFRFIFFSEKIIKEKKKILLFFLIIFSVIFEQFLNSNIQWSLKEWKTKNTDMPYFAKEEFKKNFLKPRNSDRVYGNHYFRDNQFSINMYWNWGNVYHNKIFWKYFTDFRGKFNDNGFNKEKGHVYKFFGLDQSAKKVFFHNNINEKNIVKFVDQSAFFEKNNNCKYKYKEIKNNKIIIEFNCDSKGYLSYIDNTDPFWIAKLNNKNIKIEKLFHTYKSIYFDKGNNILVLNYKPFKIIFYKLFKKKLI